MEFERGDVVRLKSGGPKMTVAAIVGDNTVKVQWFTTENYLNLEELPIICIEHSEGK